MKSSARGFTLIEMMIAIAIIGILAALAVNYSGNFFDKSRLNQVARGCYTAVSVARAEAVRNARHTIVAFEPDRCVAFYDNPSGVGTRWKYDSTDQLLSMFNYSDASLSGALMTVTSPATTWTTGVSGVGTIPGSIIFNASGYSVNLNSANTNEKLQGVSVKFQNNAIPAANNVFRQIDVTVAGAVRVTN